MKETKFLIEARKNAGLTQAALAKRLGYSTCQLISNYERQMCKLPVAAVAKFVVATECDVQKLIKLKVADYKASLEREINGR